MKRIYLFLYVVLFIALFLAEFFHPITAINVDLGRHLLLGKIILQTHHLPTTNLLSYTNKNYSYINTSWLTEVIYASLFSLGGFNLLLITNTLLVAIAFGLLIFYTTKKQQISIAILIGTTLYLLLLGLRPDIRPEIFSMLYMSFFMIILYFYRNDKKNYLFLLIPIEVLWVNSHVYFFVGPFLILLFLIDTIFTHAKKSKKKPYLVAFAGTLIATMINPNGIQGALFPFTVLQNYGLPVTENQSLLTLFTLYHSPIILFPIVTIVLLFILLIMARKNTQTIDWLLATVFSLAAIIIFRNILLFIFATFIPFITHLNFLAEKYRQQIRQLPPFTFFFFYPLSLLLLCLFVVMSVTKNGFGFGVNAYGKNAADFLITHRIQGPLYNNFDIGGYLSYRLYPQLLFVDNRPEAYPVSFFKNIYLPMQDNAQIFQKEDQKYHFNAILIAYWDGTPWGNNLLEYLVNSSHFRLIYLDQYNIILVNNNQQNRSLIAHYQIKNNPNNADIHYLFFFEKIGWRNQVTQTLISMRKTDPQLCSLVNYPLEKTIIQKYITYYGLNKNCP